MKKVAQNAIQRRTTRIVSCLEFKYEKHTLSCCRV